MTNSFEGGGGALPDYASRERCGVEVQDSRNGAGRCKKVKALREHANFGLLRDPLFLGPACVLDMGISFLGFRRVSESQNLRVSGSSRISEFRILKVSASQSSRVSEFQSPRGKKRKSENSGNH